MADIHIERTHTLGLAEARAVAARWTDDAQARFGMTCRRVAGDTEDSVEFTRSGVSGRLVVSADRFELTAKLGFLLSGFRHAIAAEIGKNLDTLLGRAEG